MMFGLDTSAWAKSFGKGAGVFAFAFMMFLEFIHSAYGEWTQAMDSKYFGEYVAHSAKYHPSAVLCAVAVALVFGAIGYLVGSVLDRRN